MQINKIASPVEAFRSTDDVEAAVSHVSSFVLEKGLLVRSSGGHLLPNTPADPSDSLPEYEGWPEDLKLLFGDVTAYSNWGQVTTEEDILPWRVMAVQEWAMLRRPKDVHESRELLTFLGNCLSARHLYTDLYVQRVYSKRTERPLPRLALRATASPPQVTFSEAPGEQRVTIYPDTHRWQKAGRFLQHLAGVEFNDADFSHPNDSIFNN